MVIFVLYFCDCLENGTSIDYGLSFGITKDRLARFLPFAVIGFGTGMNPAYAVFTV